MGAGNSKEAQLDKFGHLFSAQEKKCLSKTFHIIAGYEEATFFSRDEFQVSWFWKRVTPRLADNPPLARLLLVS